MTTDRRELRAFALSAAILAFYTVAILSTGKIDPSAFVRLAATYTGASLSLWAFLGLCGLLILMIRHGIGPVDAPRTSPLVLIARFIRDRWDRDYGVSLLWPPVMFAWLVAAFNAFKQMVLVGASFRLDPALAGIDRLLFFGHDGWAVMHALLPWPLATFIIDSAYHAWFAPMSLGLILCAWGGRKSYRLRTQYLLAYLALWIVLGSVLAYLLPAAGPCYYAVFGNGPGFQPLLDRLAHDQAAVAQLIPGAELGSLANQHALLTFYGSPHLVIGGGISAMPSLHNALAVLFALAAFRIRPWLGWIGAAYALLIWVGSIDLGWHYAIDGIVAALLTMLCWSVAGRVTAALDRAPTGEARPAVLDPAV